MGKLLILGLLALAGCARQPKVDVLTCTDGGPPRQVLRAETVWLNNGGGFLIYGANGVTTYQPKPGEYCSISAVFP